MTIGRIFITGIRNAKNAMPFVPATNVAQAELVFNWNSEICQNVLHFVAPGAIGTTELNSLGFHLANWYQAQLSPLQSQTCSLVSIRLRDLTSEQGSVIDYTTNLPLAGDLTNDSLPNHVSIAISKRTNLVGRSFRGRIYHVGMVKDHVNGNNVQATPLANIIAAYDDILAFSDPSDNPWIMVVVSKYSGGQARSNAVITQVLTLTSDGKVDSQRRRLAGRGT
jgi:hypothetical protein